MAIPTALTAPLNPARAGGPVPQAAVDRFVTALARATHRVHAYPADSPLCVAALDACHRALQSADREQLVLRVSLRSLRVDDEAVTCTASVADLARRLHHVGLATVILFRQASVRDLTWFCKELVARESTQSGDTLRESLEARGIEHISVTMLVRPSVLEIGAIPAGRLDAIETLEERRQLERGSRATTHLCPPEKGWIRLDPGSPAPPLISLTGLAQLVGDPFELSRMLMSLADQPRTEDPVDALAAKFETVSSLFHAADPGMTGTLFPRLARAVLDLPHDRRAQLLRDTVMPALLDGHIDGAMLRQFPDVDVADSLALMLEVQVAGRELMMLALQRLDLPDGRRAQIESLLERRLANTAADDQAESELSPGRITGYESGRITVNLAAPKEFREFAAFDLAIDEGAEAALSAARARIRATVPSIERLRCLVSLLALEANPEVATRLLAVVMPLLGGLRSKQEWEPLATWGRRFSDTATTVRPERPEIAALIETVLAQQMDEACIDELLRLTQRGGEGRTAAAQVVEGFGAAAVGPLVNVLEHERVRARRHAVTQLLSASAARLEPALMAHFPHPQWFVTRNLAIVLGHAGPDHEAALAGVLGHGDIRVVREALRSLARIGSDDALTAVTGALKSRREVATAAEDVFWSFPGGRAQALALLGDSAFTTQNAKLARRLLLGAAKSGRADLGPVVAPLARLRFQFWRPSHMSLGLAAARVKAR